MNPFRRRKSEIWGMGRYGRGFMLFILEHINLWAKDLVVWYIYVIEQVTHLFFILEVLGFVNACGFFLKKGAKVEKTPPPFNFSFSFVISFPPKLRPSESGLALFKTTCSNNSRSPITAGGFFYICETLRTKKWRMYFFFFVDGILDLNP